jgi:hypothetical protein
MKPILEVIIDGEEYTLVEHEGRLGVNRGNYFGHFAIVAQKDGQQYPVVVKEKA